MAEASQLAVSLLVQPAILIKRTGLLASCRRVLVESTTNFDKRKELLVSISPIGIPTEQTQNVLFFRPHDLLSYVKEQKLIDMMKY